ncbi:recombinase family protein [Acutalibacter sp.]|uniref:recombinase family protein n=1 Tax=Acutalibacter sp. TaxID=1918636 RepID=UPI0034E0473A
MTNHDRKENARNEIRSAFENKGRVEYIPPSEPMAKSNNEKHRLKVAVYCRVSTDNLNQAGSYELQIQTYKEYVSSHPEWELVEIYADGGISGTSTRHRVRSVCVKNLERWKLVCVHVAYT